MGLHKIVLYTAEKDIKMKVFVALFALVACATASYTYHGKYNGKCDNDGLYYRDSKSFVLCSNGNSYVQPCAPGTRNSGYDRYSYGSHYTHADFCDVNLVDYGYAAVRSAYYGPYAGHHGRHGFHRHHGRGFPFAGAYGYGY